MTPTQYIHGAYPYAADRMASLLKYPEVKGNPEIASEAQASVRQVHGANFFRPPMCRMSCSPWQAWITLPAPRKSRALKNACVIRCHTPAENAPTPTPRNM